jgi:hypothetical protein
MDHTTPNKRAEVAARRRARYQRDRKATIARNKRWRLANPTKYSAIQQRWKSTSPKGIYSLLKKHSAYRGLSVMSQAAFVAWYVTEPKVCVYCGLTESQLLGTPTFNGRVYRRLTIDRMDSVHVRS